MIKITTNASVQSFVAVAQSRLMVSERALYKNLKSIESIALFVGSAKNAYSVGTINNSLMQRIKRSASIAARPLQVARVKLILDRNKKSVRHNDLHQELLKLEGTVASMVRKTQYKLLLRSMTPEQLSLIKEFS